MPPPGQNPGAAGNMGIRWDFEQDQMFDFNDMNELSGMDMNGMSTNPLVPGNFDFQNNWGGVDDSNMGALNLSMLGNSLDEDTLRSVLPHNPSHRSPIFMNPASAGVNGSIPTATASNAHHFGASTAASSGGVTNSTASNVPPQLLKVGVSAGPAGQGLNGAHTPTRRFAMPPTPKGGGPNNFLAIAGVSNPFSPRMMTTTTAGNIRIPAIGGNTSSELVAGLTAGTPVAAALGAAALGAGAAEVVDAAVGGAPGATSAA